MDVDLPWPPDPYLTPEQQLMVELGWLDLWHALREESAGPPDDTGGAATPTTPSATRASCSTC